MKIIINQFVNPFVIFSFLAFFLCFFRWSPNPG